MNPSKVIQPTSFALPKAISPADSGTFSIGSCDLNERASSTIMPLHNVWSSNEFGFGGYTPTVRGEPNIFSETDRLVASIWKDDLNASKQFRAPFEQCEHDCQACWTPNGPLTNARKSSTDDKRLVGDCKDCTQLIQFERLLNLAESIYQANYDEVTHNAESFIDPATNLPIFADTRFCRFCKNNKEKREVYLSHTTRNKNGETTCPILMRHICEECGATGVQAHTRSYCPMMKASKSEDLKLAVKLYHGDRKLA